MPKVEKQPSFATDRPRALARWLTNPSNTLFARNLMNRHWAHFLGRGLVEPVDDLRDTNPPANPELLDALARDLISHHYDLCHLLRTIMNSATYRVPARGVAAMFAFRAPSAGPGRPAEAHKISRSHRRSNADRSALKKSDSRAPKGNVLTL